MDKISVGKFIAERRKMLSLTQKQLAEKLCVTDKAVSRWETGKSYPDIETIESIAEVFEVTVNEVLSGKVLSSEEKENTAKEIIVDSFKEKEKVYNKWLKLSFISILCFVIVIAMIPVMYFILIPDLREGNSICYSGVIYNPVDERDIPNNFVFYAHEKGYEQKILGRDGVDLIRESSEKVVYNREILGRNQIFISFDISEIPSLHDVLNNCTVRLFYKDYPEFATEEDIKSTIESMNNCTTLKATIGMDLTDYDMRVLCVSCDEFDGYYILGYVFTGEKTFFQPFENDGEVYEMDSMQMTMSK